MFSSRTMALGDWDKIKHFRPDEFTTKDPGNVRVPVADKMGYEFVLLLDAVREDAGVPMHVSSSYRTPSHNVLVGGAEDSAHMDEPCNAADIVPALTPDDPHGNRARWAIVNAFIKHGCKRVGIYADGSIHADMTDDKRPAPVLWTKVDNPAH